MTTCIAVLIAVGLANMAVPERRPGAELTEGTQPGLLRVDSKVFDAVAYDGASRTLILYFDGGEIYEYHDIPANLFARLMSSESKGRYFSRNIRGRCRFYRRAHAIPVAAEMPRNGDSLTRKGREP